MKNWEYKTVQYDLKGLLRKKLDTKRFDEVLNMAAKEGWELHKLFELSENTRSAPTLNLHLIFRRQQQHK